MQDYLSDIEIAKIEVFNNDEVMAEAVKKVLLASAYTNGTLRKDVKVDPLRNGALALVNLSIAGRAIVTDEQLGQDLRGLAHGVNAIEAGFQELGKIKKEEKVVESPYNEAI